MHRRLRSVGLVVVLGLLAFLPMASADRDPVTGENVGDVMPETFADLCRHELPEERRQTFDTELDRADRALRSGDADAGEAALGKAFSAVYRGGAESDLAVKCLGEPAARRWFESNRMLYRQRATTDPKGKRFEREVLTNQAIAAGTQGVVAWVRQRPARGFVSAFRILEGIESRYALDREFGAFMLPEEAALAKTCRDSTASLREYAIEQRSRLLAKEGNAFDRASTPQEESALRAMESSAAVVDALAGEGEGTFSNPAADRDVTILNQRVDESMRLLREARQWNLAHDDDRRDRPSAKQARARGELMMTRSKERGASLWMREALFVAAERYFDWGGFESESQNARSALASIQGELDAAERDRDASQEAAIERLQREAASMRKATDEIRKSESEQESFKEEADALEEELGF